MKKVILDVDTGIDDAIAIILALGCNDIDVLGITTVSGNIHVDRATLNTKRLLKFLNREDVNIYKGMSKPIQRELVDASHIHGKSGLAGQLEDIEVDEYVDDHALKFIEEQILSNPDEITIIATGPQTNIARLLEMKPKLAKMIKSMMVMGGAISVKGNCTPVAEFNISTDPEAVFQVIHAGIDDYTLVSLDVTQKALLKKEDLKLIKNDSIRNFIEALTKDYMNRYYKIHGRYACPMHDPLVILQLIENDILTLEKRYVTVETNSEYSDGMTICDFDNHWDKKPNVKIATDIDEKLFKDKFFEIINQVGI